MKRSVVCLVVVSLAVMGLARTAGAGVITPAPVSQNEALQLSAHADMVHMDVIGGDMSSGDVAIAIILGLLILGGIGAALASSGGSA